MNVVKARTLETKAKAKDMTFCSRRSSRPRPVLEDYITAIIGLFHSSVFLINF
jgi:hypothetical protein